MTAWCMANPWLTFFVVIAGLGVVESIVARICGRKP